MAKLLCFMAGAALLTACATASEPRIEVRKVEIPVAVKCSADPGPEPTFADTDAALLAAPDIFARTKLLLAGRLQRMAWIAQLTAANSACR